jgi:predicted Zn-dependent protease with MMP-like domain
MQPDDLIAPALADFERIAQTAYEMLPEAFRQPCDGLLIRVADFADDETLAEMEIENAFELTGLYQGIALTEKSVMDTPTEPDTVWLYRRPILDEWAERGDVALDHLIAHVLVHEIAHHFGYSDDDIAKIDDWRL